MGKNPRRRFARLARLNRCHDRTKRRQRRTGVNRSGILPAATFVIVSFFGAILINKAGIELTVTIPVYEMTGLGAFGALTSLFALRKKQG
ncbi:MULTISPECIES: hypothetical protein [Streptomyces]|uniref:hypothetical protein n=1 Tax=Streptomyces TaxID=1883 RepID=UPI000FD6B044|nr:hypothetical protein [Streptomyces sp. B29(2018)]